MKFIHTADVHLDMELGTQYDDKTKLNLRTLDYFRSFDNIVNYAVEKGFPAILIAGDIFRTPCPSIAVQKEFLLRLRYLESRCITTIILCGNHDVPTSRYRAHALELYKHMGFRYITIVDNPRIICVGDCAFACIPSMFAFDKSLESVIAELTAEMNKNYYRYKILAAHCCIYGSKVRNGVPLREGVDLSLFTKTNVDYIALGDVHKYQVLNNSRPVAIYPGSIERVSFNEEHESKGFVTVDFNRNPIYEFVELNTRLYKTLDIDLTSTNVPVTYINPKSELKDAVVRIRVKKRPEQTYVLNPDEWAKVVFHYVVEEVREGAEEAFTESKFLELDVNNLIEEYLTQVLKLDSSAQLRILEKAKELGSTNIKEILARYGQ